MAKIDKKDLKILKSLDENSRMSFTQIGKNVGLSKETVQYRYNKLVSEGVLRGFWMVPKVDSSVNAYKVLLKSKGISNESFEKIKDFLVSSKVVAWMAICEGYWNIHVTLLSSKDSEISLVLKKLFTTFSSFFVDIQFHKSLSLYALSEKYLYEKPLSEYFHDSFLNPPLQIDKTNKKILDLISSNARISFVDIAKNLGITPEAVLPRYKKVKEYIGVLKPRIDYSKLGLNYYHLWLRLSDGSLVDKIISHCIRDKYSVFIMEHLGKYHLHIELVCRESEINDYIGSLMEKFEKVISEYDLCRIVNELKIRVNQ